MPAREHVFTFGDVLPADEPLARWVTCLAMAWNDIVFTHALYIEHDEGGQGIYLVRVAAGHLSEVLDRNGHFGLGYEEWPAVRGFVAALPKKAREDFELLRGVQAERADEGTLGWKLDRLRNHVFHYPHLHAARPDRLELTRTLREKGEDDGSVSVQDGTLKGTRLGFADEISITLAFAKAKLDSADVRSLRAFTKDLLRTQQRFIRFGEIAIDRYLRSFPDGT